MSINHDIENIDILEKYIPEFVYQGDIIIPDSSFIINLFGKSEISKHVFGFVIASNTCDIYHENVKQISICPILPLKYAIRIIMEKAKFDIDIKNSRKRNEQNKTNVRTEIKRKTEKFIENLVKYNKKEYFLIPKSESFECIKEDSLILLDNIINVPCKKIDEEKNNHVTIDKIKEMRKCTLKSPWKEKLGWKIGYLYNRVALEDFSVNYIKNSKKEYFTHVWKEIHKKPTTASEKTIIEKRVDAVPVITRSLKKDDVVWSKVA